MTPEEHIARAVLDQFGGAYYVAGTDTQRNRVIEQAAQAIAPMLEQIRRDAVRATDINPT